MKTQQKVTEETKVLKPRLCVVCGARVINMNPRTVTCDSICTAARHIGRTRERQIKWEMNHPPRRMGNDCPGCGNIGSQCDCWDPVNGIN